MNNIIEKYLHDFKKALKVEPTIRNKIVSDIRYDIENKMSDGETAEDIIAKYGSPKELAQEFNQNYPEFNKLKQIRKAKIFALVSFVVAAVCCITGIVGQAVFFNEDNVSHTGGVDLPSQVITTSEPISVLFLFDILIKISIVLAVIALIGVGYFILKSKKKG